MSSERRRPPEETNRWKIVPQPPEDSPAADPVSLDGRTLRIECETPELAELVRQIDHHGGLDVLVDAEAVADSEQSRWIELKQPPGEPLNHLIDRLGSRPPPVLVDAWCHQLEQIEAKLDAAELPFHSGNMQDLRVDAAARLHIAYLPLRIAESICQAEPECERQGSLAPWLRSQQEIDLGGFDFLLQSIENLSPAPAEVSERLSSDPPNPQRRQTEIPWAPGDATASTAGQAIAGVAPAIAVAGGERRAAAGELGPSGRRARRRGGSRISRRVWIAAATAAAILIAVVVFWNGRSGGAAPSGADRDAGPRGAALRPAADAPQRQVLPEQRQPEQRQPEADQPLVRLTEQEASETAELERAGGADLGMAPLAASPLVAAPVESFGPEPQESEPQKSEATQSEAQVAEAKGAGRSAASTQAFDPPPREQTNPVQIEALAGVAVAAMRSAVLQSPGGDETWRLVAEPDPASTPAASSGALELRIVNENAAGEIRTAAVVRPGSGSEANTEQWSWAWTAEAADLPGAEQLRNSRLSIGGRPIYLRTPTTTDAVRILFDQPQQTAEWSLATAAAARRSQLSITAAASPREPALQPDIAQPMDADPPADPPTELRPLWIHWPEAVVSEADRSTRGLAEIRDSEESPIAVRIRFDIQAGRSIELETQAVATIEASSGWQPASRQGVSEAQDRVHAQRMEIEQLLRVIEQQYPGIEDRDARAAMRARREALEEQQKVLETWTERLGELQVLMARIAAEVQWQIELKTEWPETSQTIFVSR